MAIDLASNIAPFQVVRCVEPTLVAIDLAGNIVCQGRTLSPNCIGGKLASQFLYTKLSVGSIPSTNILL